MIAVALVCVDGSCVHSPPECQMQRRAQTLSPPPPRTVEHAPCSLIISSLRSSCCQQVYQRNKMLQDEINDS